MVKPAKMSWMAAAFIFTIFGCGSFPTQIPSDHPIVGTWAWGTNDNMVILQFRSSGKGCEIAIDQRTSGFSLTYSPFDISLTDETVTLTYRIAGGTPSNTHKYEIPASGRLTLFEYRDGMSPILVKQQSTAVEGYWKGQGREPLEYIFAGSVLVKLQDGVPFAFGHFRASENSLILIEQVKYLETSWVSSNLPDEILPYNIDGKTLSWNSQGRNHIFSKQ